MALAAACAGASEPANEERFVLRGVVTWVVDGDTLHARVRGRDESVRLIGIDTPERGECGFRRATRLARRLADGRRVTLIGDPTQDRRDRYDRLLAYAIVGGRDLGLRMLASGLARVYVFERPFRRVSAYRAAERAGRRASGSIWRTCR